MKIILLFTMLFSIKSVYAANDNLAEMKYCHIDARVKDLDKNAAFFNEVWSTLSFDKLGNLTVATPSSPYSWYSGIEYKKYENDAYMMTGPDAYRKQFSQSMSISKVQNTSATYLLRLSGNKHYAMKSDNLTVEMTISFQNGICMINRFTEDTSTDHYGFNGKICRRSSLYSNAALVDCPDYIEEMKKDPRLQ